MTPKEKKKLSTINPAEIRVERLFCSGGTSKTWFVSHPDIVDPFVLKIGNAYSDNKTHIRRQFENEWYASLYLNSDRIVSALSFGYDADINPYLFFEYIPHQALRELLPSVYEGNFCKICIHILLALRDLERAQFVHCDLKPENILVSESKAYIIDLGLSRHAGLAYPDAVGTPYYMSPEQASAKPIVCASDIYAFGIMLYECMTGHLPFRHRDPVRVMEAQCIEHVPKIENTLFGVDKSHLEACYACLEKWPQNRPRISDLLSIFRKQT